MTVYDWNALSIEPAIRQLAGVMRRRWNVWVGLIDAEGTVFPVGDRANRVDLPVCERLAANPVTLEDDTRTNCAGAIERWRERLMDDVEPGSGAVETSCHAGLAATIAPVWPASSDRPIGGVYVSGYLNAGGSAGANAVRRVLMDNDLTGGLPEDAFDRISRMDRAHRNVVAELAEAMADTITQILTDSNTDCPTGDRAEDDGGLGADGQVFEGMLGRNRRMLDLFDKIATVADTNATVLIRGENGTGKELVARALHRRSHRSSERFVALNCAAVPSQLIESELFGHKKGAFSGAHRDRVGLCEEADGGTLMLDEIGDMTRPMQAKLLRFLQENRFSPVGSSKMRSVDVRVLCATNQNLEELVETGEFRRDLFFRINVVRLGVPPLRERCDDIPLLVEHFASRAAKEHGRERPEFGEACMEQLVAHDWPGNVRELENEVDRLVIMAEPGEVIGPEQLSPRVGGEAGLPPVPSFEGMELPDAVEQLERRMILDGLQETGWNKTHTAEKLGVSRRNLIRKVKRFELEQYRDEDS